MGEKMGKSHPRVTDEAVHVAGAGRLQRHRQAPTRLHGREAARHEITAHITASHRRGAQPAVQHQRRSANRTRPPYRGTAGELQDDTAVEPPRRR